MNVIPIKFPGCAHYDVIVGVPGGMKHSPGNILLRQLVSVNVPKYLSLPWREKKTFRHAIVAYVQIIGGRFVRIINKKLVYASDQDAVDFVQNQFSVQKRRPSISNRKLTTVLSERISHEKKRQSARVMDNFTNGLENNPLIKSSLVRGFLQTNPSVGEACERIAWKVFGKLSRLPNCPGEEGVVLTAGRGHEGSPVEINVKRSAYLRQNFSKDNLELKPKDPSGSTVFRYSYGTASGGRSAGISRCHTVIRSFSNDMAIAAEAIQLLLKNMFEQKSATEKGGLVVDVKFNHMVAIGLYDKGQSKSGEQVPFHRDQVFGATGNFLSNRNTQMEDTATCVVVLGEPRLLHMQAYRIDSNSKNKHKRVDGKFAHEVVKMCHGDLFVLHCDCERPAMREYLDANDLTYFKHGGVVFGGDQKFSIGLAFRVVTKSEEVRKRTGQLVISNKESKESQIMEAKWHMGKYIADKSKWVNDDLHRIKLFSNAARRNFQHYTTM